MSATLTTLDLWRHIYPRQDDPQEPERYVGVFSGKRQAGSTQLLSVEEKFYPYPISAQFAAGWLENEAKLGREAYQCAHLVTRKRRQKPDAAKVWALYFEKDGGALPPNFPRPTAVVQSSPGKTHNYLRTTRALDPAEAEEYNRRLAHLAGGDPSGFDLTQLYRAPNTRNHKYPDKPLVTVLYIEDRAYDPDELDRLLPPAPLKTASAAGIGDPLDWSGAEPPVRLDAEGRAWWTGARYACKQDGATLDRSDTLFGIGYRLGLANAPGPLIAGAVAERDRTLGHRKYTDRPDAAKQYTAIAAKVLDRLERERPQVGGVHDGRPIGAERVELGELRAFKEATIELVQAEGMTGTEKIVALAASLELASAQSRGAIDGDGKTSISATAIAENVKLSRQCVSSVFKRWSDWGHMPCETPFTGQRDAKGKPLQETRLRAPACIADARAPAGAIPDLMVVFSTFKRPDSAPKHGGNGERCPECGGTERKRTEEEVTTLTTTISCATAGCGHVHSQTSRQIGKAKAYVEFFEPSDIPTMIDRAPRRAAPPVAASMMDAPPVRVLTEEQAAPTVTSVTPPPSIMEAPAWGPVCCTDCYAEGRRPAGEIWACAACMRQRRGEVAPYRQAGD